MALNTSENYKVRFQGIHIEFNKELSKSKKKVNFSFSRVVFTNQAYATGKTL